ncbi:lasso RiPP family leader peptide-containing protein [Streptomyces mexicanus]|uniref:Lasso RiPP family leader peptide-containing protein n=1 Tax=Streptomyces mexicanus TaxID=178566 RepID=A0A7X1I182_9ACTN|nr:lasso RiPP family leader peptide-containing protein [Streptomyces mexicanus]
MQNEVEVYEPPILVEVGTFTEETRGQGWWAPEGWGSGTWG